MDMNGSLPCIVTVLPMVTTFRIDADERVPGKFLASLHGLEEKTAPVPGSYKRQGVIYPGAAVLHTAG